MKILTRSSLPKFVFCTARNTLAWVAPPAKGCYWKVGLLIYGLAISHWSIAQTNSAAVISLQYEETTRRYVVYDPTIDLQELAPGEYLNLMSGDPEVTRVTESFNAQGAYSRTVELLTPGANRPAPLGNVVKYSLSRTGRRYYAAGDSLLFEVALSSLELDAVDAEETLYSQDSSFQLVGLGNYSSADLASVVSEGGSYTTSANGKPTVTLNGLTNTIWEGGRVSVESYTESHSGQSVVVLQEYKEVRPNYGRFLYEMETRQGLTSTGKCFTTTTVTARNYLPTASPKLAGSDSGGIAEGYEWYQIADEQTIRYVKFDLAPNRQRQVEEIFYDFMIISSSGQVVRQERGVPLGQVLDLVGLLPGVYVLRSSLGNQTFHQLIVL